MFLVALNIKPNDFLRSVKNYKIVLFALLMVFLVPPLLSFTGKPFFSPIEYSALVIALSSPAAVSSVFWCDVFHGHTPLALIVSMLTNLLAVLTIPLTILIATQMTAELNALTIITNLLFIVVIPLLIGQVIRTLFKRGTQKVINNSTPLQHILLLFLVWGAVAPGAIFTQQNPAQFVQLTTFILLVLTTTFSMAYTFGKRYGRSKAIALGIVSSHKNATLAIIIGDLLLGPLALPTLIANLVGQNLFLIPARAALHFTQDDTKACNI